MEIKQISLAASKKNSSRILSTSFVRTGIESLIRTLIDKAKNLLAIFTSLPLFIKKIFRRPTYLKKRSVNSFNAGDRNQKSRVRKFNKKINPKKFIKPLLITVVVVTLLIAAQKFVKDMNLGNSSNSGGTEIKGAKASQDINREFSFPLRDEEGESLSDIKYTIEKAELLDEIVVKGQRATTIKGRTFLIITLKIKNEYRSDIEMDTRDYVRLSVNGNRDEWLAPDIHNDPVEVQAISTKYTRIGFPINDSDTDLVLRVGEIDGEKEEIPLELD